ncbi:MAG TPA: family 1 glycosylhydrolase [Pyrinomonadaceae bacterium]|jgi:dTDP-4-dehydrorhamnose reductase
MLSKKIELWGGIECTHNRVGDEYFDQLEKSGHDRRPEDLALFADLGITALRFPVLWERVTAPEGENKEWSRIDERLELLRRLRVRPIVGLVHHGSGPPGTSLVSDCFPEKLAEFAARVARRYPWLDAYTPINEPLTTARFSGLYGFWYPHGRGDVSFARALINQCRATVLAMRAIRRVNPQAEFIQTEDLGKTYCAPSLEYQADFENERRFLAFDLLSGRVDRSHPLRSYLRKSGVKESEIEWFRENRCVPDVLGFNHYPTSERYLDERVERFPGAAVVDNGKHVYADVEAVRVDLDFETGLGRLLREAWKRYRLPLALTEIHLGCTREEQLRWFLECWKTAEMLRREEGVDLQAVTAWSLLGSYDWNSLVTKNLKHYESGVFDVRGGAPRPTALAKLLRALAEGENFEHPVLENPGWWRRPDRFIHEPAVGKRIERSAPVRINSAKPLLIAGATAALGRAFAKICEIRGIGCRLLSRAEMDIADAASVNRALDRYDAWALVNCAGYERIDTAEDECETCFRENAGGAAILAQACERKNIQFLTFSSALVFDGKNSRAYVESDAPAPLSVYGKSKAKAEKQVLEMNPHALVIRSSAFFGPWDDDNFLKIALRTLSSGRYFKAADDSVVSPTYIPDLVDASLDLLIDRENGIWHLAQQGAVSWADFARRAAELARLDSTLIIGCSAKELNLTAPRPPFSALGSERGLLLSSLENGLARFVETHRRNLEKMEKPLAGARGRRLI